MQRLFLDKGYHHKDNSAVLCLEFYKFYLSPDSFQKQIKDSMKFMNQYSDHKLISKLIECGAEPDACYQNQNSLLQKIIIYIKDLYFTLYTKDFYNLIQKLMSAGANPDLPFTIEEYHKDVTYCSILHYLIESYCSLDCKLELIKLLLEGGANPNIDLGCQLSLLTQTKNNQIIQLLIEYGADVNRKGVLLHAINNDDITLETLRVILQAGASVKIDSSTLTKIVKWNSTHGAEEGIKNTINLAKEMVDGLKNHPINYLVKENPSNLDLNKFRLLLQYGMKLSGNEFISSAFGRNYNIDPYLEIIDNL